MNQNNLRKLRLNKGMTLKELAEKTDLSKQYLLHLEKGLRKGTPNTWLKLSKVLDVPARDFFTDRLQEEPAKYCCI